METIISASLYNEILMRHGSIHTPFDLGYCSNHVLQLTSCSPPLIMLHCARQVFTALFLIHAREILIFFFFYSLLFVLFGGLPQTALPLHNPWYINYVHLLNLRSLVCWQMHAVSSIQEGIIRHLKLKTSHQTPF